MDRPPMEYLQEKLDNFMVPASESDVQSLAIIHALRATTDSVKRLADQHDETRDQMSELIEGIHKIDKRLAIIEANSLTKRVDSIEDRVKLLENSEQRRIGAVGLVEWLGKNWPAVLPFLALAAYLLADKGVAL